MIRREMDRRRKFSFRRKIFARSISPEIINNFESRKWREMAIKVRNSILLATRALIGRKGETIGTRAPKIGSERGMLKHTVEEEARRVFHRNLLRVYC